MNNPRRKILLALFAVMVALVIGDRLWTSFYSGPLAAARAKSSRLTQKIQETRQGRKRLQKWQKRLEVLRDRSLPENIDTARTLYQGWLTELVEKVSLDNRRVDSNEPRQFDGYYLLPFSLRGSGTLEQFTIMLHQFYTAPYLHKIRTFTITPIAGSRQLSLNLTIEALLIGGTDRIDELPTGTNDELAFDRFDEYRVIAKRNIFSTSGGVEATEHTVLTAIVSVDGIPEAWFTNRLEDKVQKLHEGDDFWVGAFHCKIREITRRDVVIVADNEGWLLTLSESLADATALPPEF